MKKLTPAAIALLKALARGGGNYATHPSTRAALTERGYSEYLCSGSSRMRITEAGNAFLELDTGIRNDTVRRAVEARIAHGQPYALAWLTVASLHSLNAVAAADLLNFARNVWCVLTGEMA